MTSAPDMWGLCIISLWYRNSVSPGLPGASRGTINLAPAVDGQDLGNGPVVQTNVSGLWKLGTFDIPSGTFDNSVLPV